MEQKTKKKSIIAIIILALLIVALLIALALYYIAASDRAFLSNELDAGNVELSLRRLAQQQRDERQKLAALDYETELELRGSLQKELLEKDRKELALLVNPWNPVPDDYSPRLVDIGDGKFIDERCAGSLKQMVEDCKAASYNNRPVPISAYRTFEYQQGLFDDKVERLMGEGWSEQDAPDKAAQSVARPGTSEHELGFSIDIIDEYYTDLDNGQEWTSTQRWLMSHCTDYGFILRYPSNTTDITGIIYEPWHYRYVGKTIAKEINELGITYEEYMKKGG